MALFKDDMLLQKKSSNNLGDYARHEVKDVVYSVVAHECLDCVFDLLENIKRFNADNTFLVVLNINHKLSNEITARSVDLPDYAIVNPRVIDKKYFDISLLKGHIDNFKYLLDGKIEFDHFCLLASNCMFVKKFDLKKVTDFYNSLQIKLGCYQEEFVCEQGWWWPEFFKNEKMVETLKTRSIRLHRSDHEGRIYQKKIFNNVVLAIEYLDLFNQIGRQTVFEEVLLPTFEKFLYNFNVPKVCKVFWELPEYRPLVSHIKDIIDDDSIIFMAKRIFRDMDDPVRQYIRNLSKI